jgi:hypothetical protein
MCDRQERSRVHRCKLAAWDKKSKISGQEFGKAKKDSGLMGPQIMAVYLNQVENLSQRVLRGRLPMIF